MEGRFPNDQGFDEWWGIPRTTDEVFWPGNPGFEASGVEPQYILEGYQGQPSRKVALYDLKQRPLLGADCKNKFIRPGYQNWHCRHRRCCRLAAGQHTGERRDN